MKHTVTLQGALILSAVMCALLVSQSVQAQGMANKTIQKEQAAAMKGDSVQNADPEMLQVLDALKALNPKVIDTLTPVEARRQPSPADAVKAVMQKQGKTADDIKVTTKNITIPGPGGANAARIYMPGAMRDGTPLPVVVYYHGGGWVIADLDTYDATPRAISTMANAIVVSAEYRHAPEHKFPAAHEDAWASYKWIIENAKSLGGDPARIAVLGESAGGNLAINVSIMARDQNTQQPVYQALIYPVAGVDMNTPSYQKNAAAIPLNKPTMAWFFKHVIRNEKDTQDPRLDLVGKAKLTGLPKTTIITAEIDPLRSEGQVLAKKLEQAGVKVILRDYAGVTHEFFGMGAVIGKAKSAEMAVADDLKTAFGQKSAMQSGGR